MFSCNVILEHMAAFLSFVHHVTGEGHLFYNTVEVICKYFNQNLAPAAYS